MPAQCGYYYFKAAGAAIKQKVSIMNHYICLAIRYCNQSKDYNESLNLAKKAATKKEKDSKGNDKYILSDGSAMIDNGLFVSSDENKYWLK